MAFRMGPRSFDTGASGQTVTLTYDPIDLTGMRSIVGYLNVTKADTDAVDTLDGVFQFTRDGSIWHSVAAWPQITGDMSPSSTAPEVRQFIAQNVPTELTGASYEPTGSTGATALIAGSVRNQPFPGKIYSGGLWISAMRVVLTVVDADADADFEGDVVLWIS
jgi:hypothetical protein